MTEHVVRVTYGVPGHQHRQRYVVPNGLTQHVHLSGDPVNSLMLNVMHQATHPLPGDKLVDARHLALISMPVNEFGSPVYYPSDVVPSRRSLWEILNDVVKHGEVCPTHGMNCSCVDPYIREIRNHINRVIPEVERIPVPEGDRQDPWDDSWMYDTAQLEAARKARWRIAHVLNCVMRSVS